MSVCCEYSESSEAARLLRNEASIAWKAANKAKVAAWNKAWYERRKAAKAKRLKHNESSRLWKQAHKTRCAEWNRVWKLSKAKAATGRESVKSC